MMKSRTRAAAVLALAGVTLACDSGTEPPQPVSVEVVVETDFVAIGETTQVTATALDGNGDPMPSVDFEFTSNDETVATVDDGGVVTGVASGPATITATAGGVSDGVDIDVYDPEDPCVTGFGIVVPGSVDGTLEEGDCTEIFDDGSWVDIWYFEISQTTAITVDLTSTEFDAYLMLLDEEGTVLGDDNDSAGGTDARIQMNLAPGLYWILANHWPETGAGDYTLTISTGTTAFRFDAAPDHGPLPPRVHRGPLRLER